MRLFKEEEKVQRAKFYPRIIPLAKRSLGKFHGRSAFKHGMVQQYNPFWVTRLRGAQGNVFKGRRKTLSKLLHGRSTSNSMKEKQKLVQETIQGM